MKLTTNYILKYAKRDARISEVEISKHDNQAIVWLDPKWTWDHLDGNVTCMVYNIEGSDDFYRDDVATFRDHIKNIELAR